MSQTTTLEDYIQGVKKIHFIEQQTLSNYLLTGFCCLCFRVGLLHVVSFQLGLIFNLFLVHIHVLFFSLHAINLEAGGTFNRKSELLTVLRIRICPDTK